MKVLIFGTGQYYERYKKLFSSMKIMALIDNDKNKIGSLKDGIAILSPVEALKIYFDKIFILSTAFVEIEKQLLELGVSKQKIATIYDMRKFCAVEFEKLPVLFFENKNLREGKTRIAIIATSLGINGASIVVLKIAYVLKRFYHICVVTPSDGILHETLSKWRIPILIDENLRIERFDDIKWRKAFDLVLVNDLAFYNLFDMDISKIDLPVLWWIHSSGSMNDGIPFYRLNGLSQGRIVIYGVSKRAMSSFKSIVPSWTIEELCYGVQDHMQKFRRKTLNKTIFALIGSFQKRKAQNVFIDAIKKLSAKKLKQCEFWLIGSMEKKDFSDRILKSAENIKEIKIWGEMSNEQLLEKIYPEISVLVCPSLEDTMPVVCAEAMMYHHPCIVSDMTGTADYITPYANGLICKAGDCDDLADKIAWMIDHPDSIAKMGEAARRIYEAQFSMERFEKRLLAIVDENLKKEGL